MKKVFLLVGILFCSLIAQQANTYSYHPYPVVLVHGFSQIPVEPYGLPTYKKALTLDDKGEVDEKENFVMSTICL